MIVIDAVDKLPDDITLRNVILNICVIKNDGKFYQKMFLKEALIIIQKFMGLIKCLLKIGKRRSKLMKRWYTYVKVS